MLLETRLATVVDLSHQPTTEAGIAPLSAALHSPISASPSLVERTQTSLAGASW